jgi:hypothetical protein
MTKLSPKNCKNYPIFMLEFIEVRFKVGFNPAKKRKNEHPTPACFLPPSSMALSQSCFSSAAAQQSLLRLHHRTPPLASHHRSPSLPLHMSSASAATHLLIVVFCCCHQHLCCPSATNGSYLSVALSAASLQLPSSSTSSYRCC